MRILPCIVISTGLIVGASAVAQQTDDQRTASATATAQPMDRDEKGNSGWMGLIGLAGLAGLLRRDRKDAQVPGRDAPRTSVG